MRILGIDASLRRTGWALLEGAPACRDRATVVARGVIPTHGPHGAALCHIEAVLSHLITTHHPGVCYVEVPGAMNRHQGRSIDAVVGLSRAQAAALMAAEKAGVRAVEIDQARVKASFGYARTRDRASKETVQRGLANLAAAGLLAGYTEAKNRLGNVDADQADAVAIAYVGLAEEWFRTTEEVRLG